ncbi:MAG: response regulator transcription factor [Deltaproteobacteria bacterium]|nr:response regulator transcription factor [Deltaproteobacteria bacterium]
MSIKVFLADDHEMVRDGLGLLLDKEADITVVGKAADGRQAVRQIGELQPDAVVMDLAMPELNGIEATRRILEENPRIGVIILSMHATSEHIFQALQVGARGYVLKESAGRELVEAVRAVVKGRRYMTPRIQELMMDDYVLKRQTASDRSPLERLTSREREILQLVVEGKSSADIADTLFISRKTVETYRSRLTEKLGVKDVPGLVKFAIQHGLTSI